MPSAKYKELSGLNPCAFFIKTAHCLSRMDLSGLYMLRAYYPWFKPHANFLCVPQYHQLSVRLVSYMTAFWVSICCCFAALCIFTDFLTSL